MLGDVSGFRDLSARVMPADSTCLRLHSSLKGRNAMWIPKWLRDLKKGVDSPMPTQVVSNEEFIPRPQTQAQKTGRVPDRRDGRGEGQEARHGAPRLHGQHDGHGHLLSGQQHGLRQVLGRRRRSRPGSRRPTKRSSPRASTSSSTCRRTSPTALRWRIPQRWSSSRTWASS